MLRRYLLPMIAAVSIPIAGFLVNNQAESRGFERGYSEGYKRGSEASMRREVKVSVRSDEFYVCLQNPEGVYHKSFRFKKGEPHLELSGDACAADALPSNLQ